MASLRDQLRKAGLASKKDVRRVNQELKKQRRHGQSRKESNKARAARLREEKRILRAEMIRQKVERRRELRRQAMVLARQQQVDQIIRHWAVESTGGRHRFWHRPVEGPVLGRLEIPEWMARDLREGRLAIAAATALDEWEYLVIPAEKALRVRDLLPERLVHFNEKPPDPEDPAEALMERSW